MRTVAGFCAAVCVAVVSSLLLGWLAGGLNTPVSAGALALGVFAGFAAASGTRPPSARRISIPDALMLAVFGLASARAFLWVIYQNGPDWMVLSPNNLGDLSKHIHIIRFLAAGARIWPENPFFVGEPLAYYIGADVFNALLMQVGVPLERGLVWVGLAGSALTAWALWRWGGAFVIAGFLFSGGLAGFALFGTGVIKDFQADMAWKNLFLSIFVTQRGFLYALPAGLLLLTDWRSRYVSGKPLLPSWTAWFLYSTLALFAAHAFLALSIVLAALFVFLPVKRRELLTFVASSFVPAAICAWFVTGGFSAKAGIRILPGWMQEGSPVWFWVLNFGFALPLCAAMAWQLLRRGAAGDRAFAGAGLLLLVVCAFVAFAPWPWDNTKIMLWGWLLVLPVMWETVLSRMGEVFRGVCLVGLFFSGAVSLYGGLDGRHGYRLIGRMELARAASELAVVPPFDPIATHPEHDAPAVLLGRPVLCGYEGMVWAHGIEYHRRYDDLRRILARDPGWEELALSHGARWLHLPPAPPVRVAH